MDTSLLETFSVRLRETRGDTMQATFAQKIGVSRASLSSYENGTRIPDIETLKRIYEETGVSVYYLLGLTDSKDDTFGTAQRDTGLSEKALETFANHPISAKVINHLVACQALKGFTSRAAILHDDTLLCEELQQKDWSDLAKVLRDTERKSIEDVMHKALSSAFIECAFMSPAFGIAPDKLPSNSVCSFIDSFRAARDTIYQMTPTLPKAAEAIQQYDAVLDKLLMGKEAHNGEETPEQ